MKTNKYRLLAGVHRQGKRTYKTGDIISSATDLRRFNQPGSIKFEQVYDDRNESAYLAPAPSKPAAATAPTGDTDPNKPDATAQTGGTGHVDALEGMTVEQLKTLAADEEIDLGEATRKADIIAVIRAAVAGG